MGAAATAELGSPAKGASAASTSAAGAAPREKAPSRLSAKLIRSSASSAP